MQIKLLEIRDRATCIPMLCVDATPASNIERRFLRYCGYPCDEPSIIMTSLHANGGKTSSDPYFWKDRTYSTAHHYITNNWEYIKSGDVIDIEYILDETTTPKRAEID